jgi:hypothetical protein
VHTPDGNTHTTHTVTSDEPRSGGSGWVIAIVLVLAVIVGVWAFTQMGGAEVAKDEAITNAANDVGDAAQSVGDAAQDAADSIGE